MFRIVVFFSLSLFGFLTFSSTKKTNYDRVCFVCVRFLGNEFECDRISRNKIYFCNLILKTHSHTRFDEFVDLSIRKTDKISIEDLNVNHLTFYLNKNRAREKKSQLTKMIETRREREKLTNCIKKIH